MGLEPSHFFDETLSKMTSEMCCRIIEDTMETLGLNGPIG